MQVQDYKNNYTTNTFVTKKVVPQRLELVEKFPKAMLWHTDGGWMAPDAYWGIIMHAGPAARMRTRGH